jgi:hypothetical protein
MPDGSVRWLATAVSPPLGVPMVGGHPGQVVQLPPGATVVLYSDGLIERRRVPLDTGFERLAASAAAHAAPMSITSPTRSSPTWTTTTSPTT